MLTLGKLPLSPILQKHQLLIADTDYQVMGRIELHERCGRKRRGDHNQTENHSQGPKQCAREQETVSL